MSTLLPPMPSPTPQPLLQTQGSQLRIARVGEAPLAGECSPVDLLAEGPWFGVHLDRVPADPEGWRRVRRALAPGGWVRTPGPGSSDASGAGLTPKGDGYFVRFDQPVEAVRAEPRSPIAGGGALAWVRATQAIDAGTRSRMLAAFQAQGDATVVACWFPGDMRLAVEDRVWEGTAILDIGLPALRRAALAIRQDAFSAWDLAGVARALARGRLVWLADPVQTAGSPLPDGEIQAALLEIRPARTRGRSSPPRWQVEQPVSDVRSALEQARSRPDDPARLLRAAAAYDALGMQDDARYLRTVAEDEAMGLWTAAGADARRAPVRFAGSLSLVALGVVPATLHLQIMAEEAGALEVVLDEEVLGRVDLDGVGDTREIELALPGGPDPAIIELRAPAALLRRARWRS